MLFRDKHSSLLEPSVTYEENSVVNMHPVPQNDDMKFSECSFNYEGVQGCRFLPLQDDGQGPML
jgi:hypothetical protein